MNRNHDLPTERSVDPVDDFLLRAAAVSPPTLPSASQIWWRHEVLERLAEEDRLARKAARPAQWGAATGLATALLGVLFLGNVPLASSLTLMIAGSATLIAVGLGVTLVRSTR